MKLMTTIANTSRIMIHMTFNKLIYYLSRIPLIKKLIPEKIYAAGKIKDTITIIGAAVSFFGSVVRKLIYVALMVWIPVMAALPESERFSGSGAAYYVLAVLSILGGALFGAELLGNTISKYVCVKLIRIPFRQYIYSQLIYKYAVDFIGFAAAISIGCALTGSSVLRGLILTLMIMIGHFFGEALMLFIFDKTSVVVNAKIAFILVAGAVILALAYIPLFIDLQAAAYIGEQIFTVPFMLAIALLGIAALYYVLRYPNYPKVSSMTIHREGLIMNSQAAAAARFSDVRLKDEDLEKTDSKKFAYLSGYRYLNAIFFQRHKRMLNRPVVIRLYIVGACYIAALCAYFISPQLGVRLAGEILKMLPICVFFMYMLASFNDRICRAMFNNCDIAMLRYGYYRQPDIILSNFKIRLLWMLKPNILLGAAVAAALTSYPVITGAEWDWLTLLTFAASILLLAVFFVVHYLFLYYVFQPYTSELGMKNPLFRVVNGAVYILCFICLQIKTSSGYFSLIVLGATIVYIGAALALVRKYAPKNFRVK